MIEIKNVSKAYSKDKKAIDSLDLKINDGEIFGFLGPNGAGKTTTIKMITGIVDIDEGDILIDGTSITDNPMEAKKIFGFVPDSPDLFLKLKGIEYLNFLGDVFKLSKNARKSKIEDLAKRFDIFDALNDKIESYSHGMRQKLIVIGALMHEPKNWILDEPMTGLDPKSSHDLKELMKEHAKNGNTVFFSTHVLEVAEKLCDRVAIINKGKLVFVGTLDQIKKEFKDGTLEELFLEITE